MSVPSPAAGRVAVYSPPTVHSCGDRVRDGAYLLHSRFRHALNFSSGDDLVCLVDDTVGDGPVNIVLSELPAVDARGLIIESNWVTWGGGHVRVLPTCRWISRLDFAGLRPDAVAGLMARAWTDLRAHAPPESLAHVCGSIPTDAFRAAATPWGETVKRGVDLLFAGREIEAVRCLCGTGIGLTPGGDDFLVGHLAARHLLVQCGIRRFRLSLDHVPRHAARTTLLSRAAIALAAEGCFVRRVKAYVEALARGDGDAVRRRGEELFCMGFTSGADLLTGLLATLEAAFP